MTCIQVAGEALLLVELEAILRTVAEDLEGRMSTLFLEGCVDATFELHDQIRYECLSTPYLVIEALAEDPLVVRSEVHVRDRVHVRLRNQPTRGDE